MEYITARVQQFRQSSEDRRDRRAFCLNRSPPHGEAVRPVSSQEAAHAKPKLQLSSPSLSESFVEQPRGTRKTFHPPPSPPAHSLFPASGGEKKTPRPVVCLLGSLLRSAALSDRRKRKKEAVDNESPSQPSIYYSASAVIGYQGEHCCWNDGLMLYFVPSVSLEV